jgi:hypothetical protein
MKVPFTQERELGQVLSACPHRPDHALWHRGSEVRPIACDALIRPSQGDKQTRMLI